MAQDSQIPKNKLIPFAVVGLSVLLLIVLVVNNGRGSSESESAGEETQTSQEASANGQTSSGEDESDGDGFREEQDDDMVAESPENQDELPEGLPENWHLLSNAEKTALNPFACPVDEDNIVRLSAETGECLEVEEAAGDDDAEPIDIPDSIADVRLGEAFRYDDDSELSITGLSCTNLEFVVLRSIGSGLTLGQVLSERRDDYEAYKADSYALLQDYFDRGEHLAYLDYFRYLQSFERWRDANVSSPTSDDLVDQLFAYLDCEISLMLKNIGEDSSFSNGCGWDFRDPMSLVGERQTYGQEHRNQLVAAEIACTDAIVDFPNGATAADVISFIVSSEDTILEIIIHNTEDAFRAVLDRN